MTTMLRTRKAALYTTAVATISCAAFNAGDRVAVQYVGDTRSADGEWIEWFDCTRNGMTVCYPAHHLASFVL
jgi:hypothetical protein